MFSIEKSGSFEKTVSKLNKLVNLDILQILNRAGQMGVDALSAATPIDSGLTAQSWSYTVEGGKGGATVTWSNSDVENGFPVAIMLQHGYGTGTGGYVQGRDYINPAMRPIFDQIESSVRKAVTSA
jgi:hypothetical protein